MFSAREVIRLELEGAVEVLARQGNLVAAHLMASAAHTNMRSIAKEEGSTLKYDLASIVRGYDPSREKFFMGQFLLPYNQMKHVGKRSNVVHFVPDYAILTVLLAINDYSPLFKHSTPRLVLFQLWAMGRWPDFRPQGMTQNIPAYQGMDPERPWDEQIAFLRKALNDYDACPEAYEATFREQFPTPLD